jgi:hypothetical protein
VLDFGNAVHQVRDFELVKLFWIHSF